MHSVLTSFTPLKYLSHPKKMIQMAQKASKTDKNLYQNRNYESVYLHPNQIEDCQTIPEVFQENCQNPYRSFRGNVRLF
jgi:hypothetical protein